MTHKCSMKMILMKSYAILFLSMIMFRFRNMHHYKSVSHCDFEFFLLLQDLHIQSNHTTCFLYFSNSSHPSCISCLSYPDVSCTSPSKKCSNLDLGLLDFGALYTVILIEVRMLPRQVHMEIFTVTQHD